MPPKDTKITVHGQEITFNYKKDYISLTDLAKKFSEAPDKSIENWMRTKDTVEFLGLWEILNNPDFKPLEFEGFKSEAGTNRFLMSPTKWIKATNAKGIEVKAGRYFGGTFAHIDIALEFAAWISPGLKLFIIKEFQRLKAEEAERLENGWDIKRVLASINYKTHTDAIKENIIPKTFKPGFMVYASEADMLNMIVFHETALAWKKNNPEKKSGNQRDYASVEQLVVMSNMETINAMLIDGGIPREQREKILYEEAKKQMSRLSSNTSIKRLK